MAISGTYYIWFKEFLSISLFSAKFWLQRIFSFFWPTFSDLQLRIILIIDKLKDNCEKSEQLWKTLGPLDEFLSFQTRKGMAL